jgi:hypothetical protein
MKIWDFPDNEPAGSARSPLCFSALLLCLTAGHGGSEGQARHPPVHTKGRQMPASRANPGFNAA